MGIKARTGEWWKLRQLRKQEAAARSRANQAIEAARKEGAKAAELNEISRDFYWEVFIYEDEIEAMLSNRLTRKARRWGVPVPPMEEGPNWTRSTQLWTWSLTEEGAMKLRREIATEIEIAHKPWLNWGALVISLFSLIVAFAALAVPLFINPPAMP